MAVLLCMRNWKSLNEAPRPQRSLGKNPSHPRETRSPDEERSDPVSLRPSETSTVPSFRFSPVRHKTRMRVETTGLGAAPWTPSEGHSQDGDIHSLRTHFNFMSWAGCHGNCSTACLTQGGRDGQAVLSLPQHMSILCPPLPRPSDLIPWASRLHHHW